MTDLTATLAPDFLDPTDDRDVELADLDGDGWLDIITAGTFHEQPRILINLGEDESGVWRGFSGATEIIDSTIRALPRRRLRLGMPPPAPPPARECRPGGSPTDQ
ncbi:MAG: hypothetical protein GY720_22520 [bacterium]|nr:hypothetical protein [bacterium]